VEDFGNQVTFFSTVGSPRLSLPKSSADIKSSSGEFPIQDDKLPNSSDWQLVFIPLREDAQNLFQDTDMAL